MVICGIKTEFDEITESTIFKYVTSNFKNYTLEEIEKAFYMNSIGQLSQRHEHYGSFDTTFFSKVMEDWLILKSKTRQRAASLLPPIEPKPESDEQSYNGLVEYIKKHGAFPKFWAWTKVYNHMDECLMIEENNESKKVLHESVLHRMKNQLELDILHMKNAHDRKERQDNLPNEVKLECRRIMIEKWLKY